MFHSDKEVITLGHESSTDITIKFVPLKLKARHCCVVLSDEEVGDLVYSISATVNKPLPLLPEILHHKHCTFLNSETRTLHLNTRANSPLSESIIICSTNLFLEKALIEISKWKLNFRKRFLTESLHYAALSNGVSNPHHKKFLNTCTNESDEEVLVFKIENSDSVHFIIPDQVIVPTTITGMSQLVNSFVPILKK